MSNTNPVAMDAVEMDDFLLAHSTGVLSLASDDDGYGIPVSYAYQEDERNVYFRLGYTPDSQKREYVDAAEVVSLVVYDETDDGWQSVVARGPLEELTESNIDSTVEEAIHDIDIPFVTIFERSASELDFRITRLNVQKVDGRREAAPDPWD